MVDYMMIFGARARRKTVADVRRRGEEFERNEKCDIRTYVDGGYFRYQISVFGSRNCAGFSHKSLCVKDL